jgi:F-type H+-transporting ATPase subunit alpha
MQPLHKPMPVEQQIAVLYCGTHGLLNKLPLEKVEDFEREFLNVLSLKHKTDVLDILKSGVIDDKITDILEQTAKEVIGGMI